MLEQLFGSKTRTKLLKLFFMNPDEAFFIRELTRKIDTQINSVRRELTNLTDCGLLVVLPDEEVKEMLKAAPKKELLDTEEDEKEKASDKQQKKFYRVNTDFVLFNEIRALFMKSPLLVEHEIIDEIKQSGQIEYACLTGYFVDEDRAPTDLLIIGEINTTRIAKLIERIQTELEREINYTVMSVEEYKLRKSVTDRFLFSIFEAKKKVVVDNMTPKLVR